SSGRLYETWPPEVKRSLLDRRDEAVALLRLDVLDGHARLAVLAGRVHEEADPCLARADRLLTEELAANALARRVVRDRAGERTPREGLARRAVRVDEREPRDFQADLPIGPVPDGHAHRHRVADRRDVAQVEARLEPIKRLHEHLQARALPRRLVVRLLHE